jgi:L-alanine-DL-glutamate epimerase-like enolase superfamily enzyme
LSVAASLQLEAVIPNFCIHEHHVINRATFNRELCVHDYQPVDGYMSIPDIPGIGNELSEYALKTATIETVSTAKVFKMKQEK